MVEINSEHLEVSSGGSQYDNAVGFHHPWVELQQRPGCTDLSIKRRTGAVGAFQFAAIQVLHEGENGSQATPPASTTQPPAALSRPRNHVDPRAASVCAYAHCATRLDGASSPTIPCLPRASPNCAPYLAFRSVQAAR